MIQSITALFVLAAGWSWTGLDVDRLRWNERERSQTGIESLEGGRPETAVEAFETAARLDDEDPLLRFNAGSARLKTESEDALAHLEYAAEFAGEDLAAAANYNLANARLSAGDTAGAIEAYEQSLRLEPGYENAQFNLELALRQQQQEEQDQEQQQEQGDQPQDQSDDDGENQQQDQSENPQGQPPPENQDPEEQESESQPPETQNEGQGENNRELPRFEEQPDMSAEQAAAILEAVENLEREQRRRQAAEEMKKRPNRGKDW